MLENFPLYWPEGWKRTPQHRRIRSAFRKTTGEIRKFLLHEILLLGGSKVLVSTNIPTRNDGLFYASAREPEDPGVAVYFDYQKRPMCFACDQYETVRENLQAVAMTINALRGIERWGASDMLERAFRGFSALPAAGWRSILNVGPEATLEQAESAFRARVHEGHSDHGGDQDMHVLIQARNEARKELAGRDD
jgi:hypothetical protein